MIANVLNLVLMFDVTQAADLIWGWILANQDALIKAAIALLPTIIVAMSKHPRAQGLLQFILELLDRVSLVQHSGAQPRRILGHLKFPLMRSLPPEGVAQVPSALMTILQKICKCPPAPAPAPGPIPAPPPAVVQKLYKIVVVDFGGTGVSAADIAKYAAAQQRQINEQFAAPPPVGWGAGCQYVRAAASSTDVKPDEVVIGLFAHADQPGALGYHDTTPSGMPVGHIFPPLDAQDGVAWQTTASHEILEILGDPELNLCFQRTDTGAFVAGETADAVEQDSYAIDGVPLSNWCTPLWFSPPQNRQGAKYDYLGKCTGPYEVRPGGYMQTFDPAQGWTQSYGEHAPAMRAYRKMERTTSRAARRATKAKARTKAA